MFLWRALKSFKKCGYCFCNAVNLEVQLLTLQFYIYLKRSKLVLFYELSAVIFLDLSFFFVLI